MKRTFQMILLLIFICFFTACESQNGTATRDENMSTGDIIGIIEKYEKPLDESKLDYVVENYSIDDILKKYEEMYGITALEYISDNYSICEIQEYQMEYRDNGILDYYSVEELVEECYGISFFSYLTEKYSLEEMIEFYIEYLGWECVDEQNVLINMGLICSEIEGNGCYEEFENLFGIADKIGYCPSVILGEYCFDKEERIIHDTDGECIKNISYENMSFAFWGSKQKLRKMMAEGENWLNGYKFCKKCFGD